MVEGKRIYRDSYEAEKVGMRKFLLLSLDSGTTGRSNCETWKFQEVLVPPGETKAIDLHLFADASSSACSAVAIAVVEQNSGKAKGLLVSKSRLSKRNTSIPRL